MGEDDSVDPGADSGVNGIVIAPQNDGMVGGPALAVLSAMVLGILAIGNALVLNTVVGWFHPLWLAGLLLLEAAFFAAVLFVRPKLRPAARWDRLTIIGMAVVGVAVLAHALHLAPPDLMPVSFSVDASHQHLLINYIYQSGRFPDDVGYLYTYDDYPVAPSALAAFSARAFGLFPAQTMYPLAAVLVAVQAVLVYGVIVELLPNRPTSHVLATVASLAILLPYQYSIHVFAERFYSNMIMGDLLVLLTLWMICVRDRLHPIFVAAVGVCLALGCLNSYPAWLPFIIGPVLASLLIDRRLSVRQRLITASIVGGITVALTAVAVVDQWDFITWFAPVRDRRLLPGWTSLGGVFVFFTVLGLAALIQTWRRRFGLVMFLSIDLALVAGLYALAFWDNLALYIPDKTFYFNIFVFAILVGIGLDWLWERVGAARVGNARTAGVMIVVIGFAVVVYANWRVRSPESSPISLDEYKVAYQVAQEMPDEDLTLLVRNSATFYWIYGCILNRTGDLEEQVERWQAETPTYDSWMQDATAPVRALVSDLADLPQDGRWRVIISAGESAVIEKTP